MPNTRTRTVKVSNPELGIILNIAKDAIPDRAFSDGLNIRCVDGKVKTSPGWTLFVDQDLSARVMHIVHYFKYDGTEFLVVITTAKPWRYDTGSSLFVDISGATLMTSTIDDAIISETFNDLLTWTNDVDRVKKWNGSGNYADLGGLNVATDGAGGTNDISACRSLVSFANFLHLVNTIEDGTRLPQRWRWSRINNSEDWDNLVTYGQAGFADLREGSDHLMRNMRIGSDFQVLYKERSIHIAQYVGPPTIFSRRLAVSNIGLRAPNAVVDIGEEHIFLGSDNFYVFNGLAVRPIGNPIVNTFFNALSPEKQTQVFAKHIPEETEVIFGYPSSGESDPDKGWAYNYLNGSWTFRDIPFHCMGSYQSTDDQAWDDISDTWDTFLKRWDDRSFTVNNPIILAGDTDSNKVMQYGVGWSQNGSAHNSFAITKAINARRPDIIKRILKILLDACKCGSHNLEVSIAEAEHVNVDPLSFGAAQNFALDLSGDPWVNLDGSARYIFIRFQTNGTANPWELSGYGYEIIDRSQR